MLKTYIIKYCEKTDKGNFVQVRPDLATVNRVFEIKEGKLVHVKDFFPLSEANKWIKEQRKKELRTEHQEPERRKSRSR
jgi:hypothetical protein